MHDNRTHPLLEQVPLTVSPFINLPTATTLPYTYKAMPSTLPPSAVGITATSTSSSIDESDSSTPSPNRTADKPKYVVSTSGHAAHPDDIIASCRALQNHVAKLQADAEAELRAFEERIRARDLAEKRRVAPGWLDSDARMLEPERKSAALPPTSAAGAAAKIGSEIGSSSSSGSGAAAGGVMQQLAGLSIGALLTGGLGQGGHGRGGASEMAVPDEGEELDRTFGGLGLGR